MQLHFGTCTTKSIYENVPKLRVKTSDANFITHYCKLTSIPNSLQFLIILSALSVSQLIHSNPMASAENVDRYWVVLGGDEQIPPVLTDAHGFVGLKFAEDLSKLVYIVNVDNVKNVTGVSIYQGNKNNGTVVLDLLKEAKELKSDDPKIVNIDRGGKISGTVAVGGVTADDLQGELNGKSLAELRKMMTDGSLYVTVYTKDYPNGEISGDSFVAVDRVFPDLSDFNWK